MAIKSDNPDRCARPHLELHRIPSIFFSPYSPLINRYPIFPSPVLWGKQENSDRVNDEEKKSHLNSQSFINLTLQDIISYPVNWPSPAPCPPWARALEPFSTPSPSIPSKAGTQEWFRINPCSRINQCCPGNRTINLTWEHVRLEVLRPCLWPPELTLLL